MKEFSAVFLILCISTVYTNKSEFGNCPRLPDPVGAHPRHGGEVKAGGFVITQTEDAVVANTICDEEQGWLLTNTIFEEMTCSYDLSQNSWRWNHYHRDRRSPTQPRCSHLSPKPIVQRYALPSTFEACATPESTTDFIGYVQERVEGTLDCVISGDCQVTSVTCEENEEGGTILAVTVAASTLQNFEKQTYVLDNAGEMLQEINVMFFDDQSDEITHSRRKRFGDFDDLTPDDTDTSGCDTGQIEDSLTGGCVSCTAGTFANTTDADNPACDACALDTYSTEAVDTCTDCASDGTLDVGSDSADDCVAFCTVPSVGLTSSLDPVSGDRVADEGDVTVHCDTDYTYGSEESPTVSCISANDNSNFPASCRKVSIESDVSSVEEGVSGIVTCTVLASDEGDSIAWYVTGETDALVSDDSAYTISAVSSTNDGSVYTLTSTLTILDFASADATDYACQVDYIDPILSDLSSDLTLGILDLSMDPSSQSIVTAGDDLQLSCIMSIDSTYTARTVSWSLDGGSAITEGVTDSEDSTYINTLSLSSLALTDAGTYTCSATYETADGSSSVTIDGTFDVVVRGFSTEPSDINADVGDAVSLTCIIVGDQEATFAWSKDTDTDVSSDASETYESLTTTSILVISASATTDDSGSYQCTADFAGTEVAGTAVTVAVYDIGIETDPASAAFLVGESAAISCTVKNAADLEAAPTITWYEVTDSGDVEVSSDYVNFDGANPTGTATLTFSTVTTDEAGTYKCQASYVIGETTETRTSSEAIIYVRELTTELSENTLVKLSESTTATFECTYSGDSEVLSVTWTYEGSETLPDGYTETEGSYVTDDTAWASSVAVDPVTKSSGGAVVCTFSFTIGDDISSTTNFVVHDIADLEAEIVSNAASYDVTCDYSGTDEPDSVTWYVNDVLKTDDDDGYSVTEGTLSSNDRSDILTVSDRLYSDESKSITCRYSFSSPTDTLEASTSLVFRGMQSNLNAIYYSTGSDVSMACSLGVGSDGSAPTSTEWYFNYVDDSSTAIDDSSDADYTITTDSSVSNGLYTSSISITNIDTALAGDYKCLFTFSETETYSSEGALTVRLVTRSPSDDSVYSYVNAEFAMTCTLDASDATTGVTWTGPDGVDVSGTSIDGSDYVLTLSTPTSDSSGAYTCTFGFDAGTEPTETFPDIKIEIVTLTSATSLYSTDGGVTVTLSCELTSPEQITLYWNDGSTDHDSTSVSYDSGKTTATYEITVASSSDGGTFQCRKSETEYSEDSSTLTVLTLTEGFTDISRAEDGETVQLECSADLNTDISDPVIAWYKDSSPATETATSAANDGGDAFVSTLPIVFDSDLDGSEYYCVATYSGLAASTDLQSVTSTVIMSQIVASESYGIKEVGDEQIFTCVATMDDTVDISWKKVVDAEDEDLTSFAVQDDYDTDSGTRTSTLTLSSLTTSETSDSIECYAGTLTDTMELDVVEISGLEAQGAEVDSDATFSCTVSVFDTTPTVAWYKTGSDTAISDGATTPSTGNYELTLSGVQTGQAGTYYCTVTYDEDGSGDVTFTETAVNLYVREFTSTPTTPDYIHTGDSISLVCTIYVADEAELSSTTWYIGGVEQTEGFENDYSGTAQTSTLVDSEILNTDGGVYKCEFNFVVGDSMSFETTVAVHLLTALESSYTNPSSLSCAFEGTNEPTISWYEGDTLIDTSDASDSYTEDAGSWTDNAITSVLTIEDSLATGETAITCDITFDGLDDTIETETNVIKREISSFSDTTYTNGEEVVLECIIDFGATGTGPTSASWTGLDSLTETDQYVIDAGTNGVDGTRTTTLTFATVDSNDYAATYTCVFTYSDTETYEDEVEVVVRLSSIDLSEQYVHTNAGFSITCTFTGDETPSGVTWTINSGSALEDGSDDYTLVYDSSGKTAELTKASPSTADDGAYLCVFNMATETSYEPSSTADIYVALLEMTEPESYYGAQGDDIVLVCQVKNTEVIDIYWFLAGEQITNDAAESILESVVSSSLTVTNLTSDDAGAYLCRLSETETTEYSETSVDLTILDFSSEPVANSYASSGDTVTLSCQSNYAASGVTVAVAWYANDVLVEPADDLPLITTAASDDDSAYDSEIEITMSTEQDDVQYSCRFTFSGDNVGTDGYIESSSGTLNQQLITGITAENQYIATGETLSISCVAYGNSAVTISWTFNGDPTSDGVTSTVYDEDNQSITSSLEIASVATDDDGDYVCIHSADTALTDSLTVDVYEISITHREVLSGAQVVLTCNVEGITAGVTFAWTDSSSGSVSSSDGDWDSENQESTITVSSLSDTTYTCSVTDSNGDDTIATTISLNVFEVSTTDDDVEYGTEGIVTCEITGIDEAVTVVFSDADGDISDEADVTTVDEGNYDSNAQTATLTVHNVTADGTYTCTVTSGEYSDSDGQEATVSIKMFDISISPAYSIKEVGDSEDLVCTATGDNSIDIKWKGSDGEEITSASQETYDDDLSTRISTLSLASLSLSEDDEYTCYVEFGDSEEVSATAQLDVIEITNLENNGVAAGEDVTFSCSFTALTGAATAEWYIVGDSTDTLVTDEGVVTSDSAAGTTELALSAVTYSQTGEQYYCQISYDENSDDAVSFPETAVTLYVRELSTSPTTPQYIHTDGDISLVAVLNVASESEISSTKWYYNTVEVTDTDYFTTEYTSDTQTTTYANADVVKTDGGVYKVEFSFLVGDAISFEVTVGVHLLTALDSSYTNPSSLTCTFEGTNSPTIAWYEGVDLIDSSDGSDAYTEDAGSWSDNVISSVLSIGDSLATGETAITCKVTFADSEVTDPVETSTNVIKREISSVSDTTYTIGDEVVLSCVLDFGSTGSGPDSVSWTGLDSLTETTQYVIADDVDDSIDGTRKTTLTFASVDSNDFASTYTCVFTYPDEETYEDEVEVVVRLSSVEYEQYPHTNAGFSITCTFTGDETPSAVTWNLDGGSALVNEVDNYYLAYDSTDKEAILSKTSPSTDDDGTYLCVFDMATEDSFEPSSTAGISVALLQMPQTVDDDGVLYGNPEDAMTITCTVENSEAIDVFWYKDDELITNDFVETIDSTTVTSEYAILSLSSSDDGVYSCRLDTAGETQVSEQSVTLQTNTISGSSIRLFAEAGGNVAFTCTVTGGSDVTVSWTFEGEDVTDNVETGDYTDGAVISELTIDSANLTDDGTYVCYYDSVALSLEYELDVYEIYITEHEVLSGSSVNVTCTVTGLSDNSWSITWTVDGQEYDDSSNSSDNYTVVVDPYNSSGGSIRSTIIVAAINVDKMFTCNVNAPDAGIAKSQEIKVFEITSPSDTYIEAGVATSLVCGVTGNDGTPSYVWYKTGESTAVFTDTSNAATSTYSIASPSASDTGSYYCEVTMTVDTVENGGFDSSSANLYVRDVTASFGDLTTVTTNATTLVCTYSGDDDVSSVVWSGPDGDIDSASITTGDYADSEVVSTFEFTGIVASSGGTYTCTVNTNNGDAIVRDTVLSVFYLTDMSTYYYSPSSISVLFEGTYEPTVTWNLDGEDYSSADDTEFTPTISSAWGSNSITFELALDMSAIDEGTTPFDIVATITFGDSSETYSTTTTLYKREITVELPATYEMDQTVSSDSPATFSCSATGEDNTNFAISWYIDGEMISNTDSTASLTEGAVTDSTYSRESTLTITENSSPLYNGELSCVASWSDPEEYDASTASDVNAIGSNLDEYSFSNSAGQGIMTCLVWDDSEPTSVSWTDEDGNSIGNSDDGTNTVVLANSTDDATHTYTLTYSPMTFGKEGNYTCDVEYASGETKSMMTSLYLLSAGFDPTSPYFAHELSVEFSCVYNGLLNPTAVYWYEGSDNSGTAITDDNSAFTIVTGDYNTGSSSKSSVITFNNPDVTSSGDYTCEWDTDFMDPSATMTVAIRSLAIDSDSTYSLDGSISLTCTYAGVDEGTMEWYYGSTKLAAGDLIAIDDGTLDSNAQTFTLTIDDVNPEDNAGSYSCVLSFDDTDSLEATTTVVVRAASIIDNAGTELSSIIVSDGELSAKCLLEADAVPSSVTWYVGGDEITFDGTTKIQNTQTKTLDSSVQYFSNITIKSFTTADEGAYTCLFSYSDGNDAQTDVSVLVATVTNDECIFVDYLASDEETLSCTYTGTSEASSVAFTLPDGSEVAGTLAAYNDGDSTQVGSYDLSSITSSSDGSYTCTFTLSGGETVSALQRLIARQATVATSAGTTSPNPIVRASITLTCTVEAGAKSITWYKDDSEFTDYRTVSSSSDSDDLVSEIYFTIADDSAGTYKCQAVQYDDYCTTEQTFDSADITMTIIAAEPLQNPSNATVLEGDDQTFECIFPDPFGDSETYEIVWSFNGDTVLSNGDAYSDGSKIFDGELSTDDTTSDSQITTSLTISSVTEDAAGEYMCTIKWGTIYIKSDAAVLTVRAFATSPSTTNVASGSDAVFSCITTGDAASTITFHLSSDDSSVDSVEQSDDSADATGSTITTTATLTISGATSDNAGDYYCMATWDSGSISSSTAYLSILDIETSSMATSAWGVVDLLATFKCESGALLLLNSDGDSYLDSNGDVVYASSTVTWEYYDSDTSAWADASDSMFSTSSDMIGTDGIKTSPLLVGPLTSDDDGLLVRCTVTYDTDSADNFVGGAVTSESLTLNIASVTSFTKDIETVLDGDTVTLSCVAIGESEPDFTFTTRGNTFDTSKYTYVSGPTVTSDGNTFTAEYVTTTKQATVLLGGQTVYCEASFGAGKGSDTSSLLVTTYYNCADVAITVLGQDPGVTITYVDDSDGGRVATVTCPDDTDDIRYSISTSTNAASSATCTKDTGSYSPSFLATCLQQQPFTTGYVEQVWPIASLSFTICADDSPSSFSESALQSMMVSDEDTCGPSSKIPCLVSGDCTIETDTSLTGCSYDASTEKLYVFATVNFAETVWTLAERNALKDLDSGARIQFWSCENSYSKRRRRAVVDTELMLEKISAGVTGLETVNETVYKYTIETTVDNNLSGESEETVWSTLTILSIFAFAVMTILAAFAPRIIKRRKLSHTELPTKETGSEDESDRC